MSGYDFDFFVIGGGSGGVRAARVAGALGARVGLAEERYLGGTCVNVGCIPKKLFVYAAHYRDHFEDAAGFGWWIAPPQFDWQTLLANKNKEIARLNGIYRQLLINSGVQVHDGRAKLLDPHTVEVEGQSFRAANILIATGGWPSKPEIHGAELGITSNEAFYLEELPKRVVIVGGGYIALEFASIFHGLGVDTTVVHRGPRLLRGFDDDLRQLLADAMRERGVRLELDAHVMALQSTDSGVRATLADDRHLEADQVLFATGRLPNTAGIGLEDAGVLLDDNGAVAVDELSRSSVPHIFAVGDCTNRLNLTPAALAEGQAVARTLFGGHTSVADHENVPTAVFSIPNLATVGLTEEQARYRYGEIDVYKSSFRMLKHTVSGRDERTFIKVIVDRGSGRVVGCHMVGDDAGEIIQGFAVAVKCGATKAQFDATLGIHPTVAEEFVTLR